MYTIQIKGMHCNGCKNLITMSLEDEGMTDVQVDEKGGTARFSSPLPQAEIEAKLQSIFKELKEYSYGNLQRKE